MSDRITIINDALVATGNEPVNIEYDGSAEWQAADSAYRRAVRWALNKHRWNFATVTQALASLLETSPSAVFEYGYALPGNCLHVEAVYVDGRPLAEYEIINQKLACNHNSDVVIKYVTTPNVGQWPEDFVELVTIKLEAFLLRGLNEDTDNARRRDADARAELVEVRSQRDQQSAPRAVFRSRTAARRRGMSAPARFGKYPYTAV